MRSVRCRLRGRESEAAMKIDPALDRMVIQISRPVHQRLTEMKQAQQRQLRRAVSFTEIIEQLLEKAGDP